MIKEINIAMVTPSPYQTRKVFDENEISALAKNIESVGLLNPIIVHCPFGGEETCGYVLICGEKRLRAFKKLGRKTIPADVIKDCIEEKVALMCISENIQRSSLTPFEEAEAIGHLIEASSIDSIAASFGKSTNWVARRHALLKLSKIWIKDKNIDLWPLACLEHIARLPEAMQKEIHDNISCSCSGVENERDIIYRINELSLMLKGAKFDTTDCTKCPTCTISTPNLFDDITVKDGDRCLNAECFEKKTKLHVSAQEEKLRKTTPNAIRVSTRSKYMLDKKDNAVSTMDIAIVKKAGKDTTPAIMIDGPDAGAVVHVKVSDKTAATQASAPEKTLSDKKKQLEKRRTIALIEELEMLIEQDKIDKYLVTVPPSTVLRCLIEYGAHSAREGYTPTPTRIRSVIKDINTKGTQPTNEELAALYTDAMRCICDVWREHLHTYKNPGDTRAQLERDVPRLMCEILGIDFKAMVKKIEAQIPIPKSWAKLEAEEKAAARKPKSKKS
jgi:ParB/RepB/Spo0J family partition protein